MVINRNRSDERTDIYNLGATIYHLVTGKDPTKPPYEMRPIRQWDPSFSTGLEAIIVKCTQNDPEKRYRSAGELRYALENYRKLETRYQEEKRKKWKVFTALSAMGLACILCGTVLRGYAAALRSGTYEALIREAEMSTDEVQAVARYEDAVKTKPSDVKAYSALLNDIYLSDGVFSREEAEAMTRLLGYKGSRDAHTAEEHLRDNRGAYGRFCYEMGLAYFYFYEDRGNKQLGRPWPGALSRRACISLFFSLMCLLILLPVLDNFSDSYILWYHRLPSNLLSKSNTISTWSTVETLASVVSSVTS